MLSSIELSDLRNRAFDRQYVRYLDERTADARAKVSVSVRHALRPAQIAKQLRRLGYACTPQLGRTLIWDEHAPLRKVHATSWLSGLRGIAAVKVVTFHYVMAYSDLGFQPWGTDERHTHFFELPVIRYFYAGFSSQIFFGISGYLIAQRVLSFPSDGGRHHSGHHPDLLASISIDIFRKVLRLYLPVFAITFCTALYIYYGFYEGYRSLLLNHEKLFPGDWYEPKPKQMTLWAQLAYWMHEMFDLTNVVTENIVYPFHDQHFWAILAEMRGTLHLYGLLTATSRCRQESRLVIMAFVSLLYFYWNHWEIWVFILGAMVVQLDILLTQQQHQPPTSQTSAHNEDDDDPDDFTAAPSLHPSLNRPSVQQWHQYTLVTTSSPRFHRILRYFLFTLSFYLLSYPIDGARSYAPGYIYLNALIPRFMVRKDKFYPNLGTFLLLLLLARPLDERTSIWRRILNSSAAQYLGKISFALFLTHGPVMHSLGYMLPHKLAWTFGTELVWLDGGKWVVVVGFGWAVTLGLCLWVADVWEREVEGRCRRVAARLEGWCFAQERGD